MKLIDIINRLDKSEDNESYIDIQELAYNEFDLSIRYIEKHKLKAYWIGGWYCTCEYVGYRVYFFDNEPVAISIQKARKCDEEFKWFSEELAMKVKKYLLDLVIEEEVEDRYDICDINEDIGESYKISFNNQISSINRDKATLNGEPIEILERIRETPDYNIDNSLKVRLLSGEEKIIEVSEIDFKYNIL